jgi:hypothetical protein
MPLRYRLQKGIGVFEHGPDERYYGTQIGSVTAMPRMKKPGKNRALLLKANVCTSDC